MQRSVISAVLLLSLGSLGCQPFTAGEVVSEPDQAKARAARTAYDNERLKAQTAHVEPGHAHDESAHKVPGHAAQAAKELPAHAAAAPAVPKETASAAHILIRFQGATRAGADVTRTKAQAQKLAEQVAHKAQARGANFAELAERYTEDPSGKGKGGQLGVFERGRMVPEFDTATFALAPGQTSGVVETGFGFHIIHREK